MSDLQIETPRVRRRRKEARPSELTAAALDLFVEKGYAATRLDDVAERAGVAKGTLYLYFENKEALFKAVIEEAIVPLLYAAEQQTAEYAGSSAALVKKLLRTWWDQFGATRLAGVEKLMIAEARNFPAIAQYYNAVVADRARRLLRLALQRGIANGEFRGLDIDTAIEVIVAPLMMLVVWRYSYYSCGQELDPERFLQTHFDLLLSGLCLQKGDN